MIHKIRTSRLSKIIASYLAIQLIITTVQPSNLFALTGGPSQPEFNSFTPIGTSDMVNLSSGDFNYNIPIMDVGGYPLNLSYDSGIGMDQEASWVGLGWNLNVGQINRQVRGLPDDFNGDKVKYETNMKDNKTVGMSLYVNASGFGIEGDNASGADAGSNSTGGSGSAGGGSTGGSTGGGSGEVGSLNINLGLSVQHNNYEGISAFPSFGFAFDIAEAGNVGMNFSGSAEDGPTATPSLGISSKLKTIGDSNYGLTGGLGLGVPLNSRQGLSAVNINSGLNFIKENKTKEGETGRFGAGSVNGGANVTFNDLSFTPQKRNSFHTNSFTGDLGLGFDIWGFSGEGGLSAFASIQKLNDRQVEKDAYGYEYTKNARATDILDFNRENDKVANRHTKALATVNYTYDIYAIKGQGTGGQFRPYKSQVGYVFDEYVKDTSESGAVSIEGTGGAGAHLGGNLTRTSVDSHTGVWGDTEAVDYFKPVANTKLDYEDTYFKSTGDLNVDDDFGLFDNPSSLNKDHLGGENAIALKITGSKHNRKAASMFTERVVNSDGTVSDFQAQGQTNTAVSEIDITDKLYRRSRERRNQAILKINKEEASINDAFVTPHNALENGHLTNGIKILNPDGATYIYGEAAVNTTKQEVTFAASGAINPNTGKVQSALNLEEGTVLVNGNDNIDNQSGIDNYFNRITTPAYAHTFLLTSVLSSDYEDVTGDGPSDDDMGAYTKFHYEVKSPNYKWRVPFTDASYNAGFYTKTDDQKGSYLYGEKEIKYVTKIETKTHVAFFDLSERNDGYGVSGKEGGLSTDSKMFKIDAIRLYSKPEAIKANLLDDDDTNDDTSIQPIKTAHFQYDYSLCKGVPNNTPSDNTTDDHENNFLGDEGGKLTLRSVYFTYRSSEMGKYTPYVFNYDNFNPDYQVKSYDVWGNYKPLFEDAVDNFDAQNETVTDLEDDIFNYSPVVASGYEIDYPITAQEYPFVQQDDRALQDLYAKAWTMSSIDLPSGGRIEMTYESDDYQYVQDRKAMKMYRIAGMATDADINGSGASDFDENNNQLYGGLGGSARYVVVEVPNTPGLTTDEQVRNDFIEHYLGDHYDKPIYFKYLLNMTNANAYEYDYVTGYFNIDKAASIGVINKNGKRYVALPMALTNLEGGVSGSSNVNPISKAGWYFGRTYLNRYTVNIGDNDPQTVDFMELLQALGSSFASFSEFITGPNGRLRNKGIAEYFIKDKSYIRLQHPGDKLGGGLRVSKIQMYDQWDQMVGKANDPDRDLYAMTYGQEYSYDLAGGGSSGVAAFEPNYSRENPFVEPFYNGDDGVLAPKEVNYTEKPFGASFFPSATVTYSRVQVNNLSRSYNDIDLKKHATGRVINEFYTTKDFPTKVSYTAIDGPQNYDAPNNVAGNSIFTTVLNLTAQTHLTLSQGFSIVTNDMNGKSKSQWVYDQYDGLISGVEYHYNVDENTGELNNLLPTIGDDGKVSERLIGTQYDVITDFRENYSKTKVKGGNINVDLLPPSPLPWLVGIVLPNRSNIENVLHTTTTTKVVHKTGILVEKVAHDLGATVSTKNLAWDAKSGQVLLTETINEYQDNYYNFTYPAHWAYPNMGQAVDNLGLEVNIESLPHNGDPSSVGVDGDEEGQSTWYTISSGENIHDYFNIGDEVAVKSNTGGFIFVGDPVSNPGFSDGLSRGNRYWVNQITGDGSAMVLINNRGQYLNPCGEDTQLNNVTIKVVRSAKRNLQTASMASVTSMVNPAVDGAIEASDFIVSESSLPDDANNKRIINASAVEYKDYWRPPIERGIRYPVNHLTSEHTISYPRYYIINPFVYNILGDWRAVKSYAYLTGRNETQINDPSPRKNGFFTSFRPFYIYDSTEGKWVVDPGAINPANSDAWTYASEVSAYSPLGAELENKDALNRYSSAQYGYNYTLPIAVASNSEHRQIGYDGFEDSRSSYYDHFSFRTQSQASNDVLFSDEEAHTGKYSLKLGPNTNTRAIVRKPLTNNCEDFDLQSLDCAPPECDNGCDITEFPDCNCQDVQPVCPQVDFNNTLQEENGSIRFTGYEPGNYPSQVTVKASNNVVVVAPGASNGLYGVQINSLPEGITTFQFEITDSDNDTCCSQIEINVIGGEVYSVQTVPCENPSPTPYNFISDTIESN